MVRNDSQVTARKYNSTNNAYFDIPNATVIETAYQNQHALKLTYTITDNGMLDLNPITGKVTDPVGLAVSLTLFISAGSMIAFWAASSRKS